MNDALDRRAGKHTSDEEAQISRGRLKREPGGDPGGACASSRTAANLDATSTTGASAARTAGNCVEWSGDLAAVSWLPLGTVDLQHSSASFVGRHLPLWQHSAAFFRECRAEAVEWASQGHECQERNRDVKATPHSIRG